MRIIFIFLLGLVLSCGYAKENSPPLPADQAFVLSAYLDQHNKVVFEWNIAPGYYLYRSQLKLTSSPTSQVRIGKIELPRGYIRQDRVHGVYQAYAGLVKISVPLQSPTQGWLNLYVNYQGCSQFGFCYTPIKKSLRVDLSRVVPPQNLNQYVQSAGAMSVSNPLPATGGAATLFGQHNLFMLILSFLGLGLLLAFTPCVLPMVPILSGIIVGHQQKIEPGKSFLLSITYVGGMAITYAILGIVIALIGSGIQAELQKPWIIVLFSGLFVLLALSLFGFYELQLPKAWQQRLFALSNRQKGGTYLGVFLMGSLSTLIVSPCVSAPLIGVLAYIGQTGDIVLGAISLLALGVGMGLPLLLIGVSADKFLPKAGPWMITLERFFGIMMLGVAIFMLSRMIQGPLTLFLWAMLCFFAAVFIGVFSPVPRRLNWAVKGSSVLVLGYCIILFIGAVEGNTDPFHPWEQFKTIFTQQQPSKKLSFITVHSMAELNQQLTKARSAQKPVMLDFYVDWCTACVIMDTSVFAKPKVQHALQSFVLLRADVTANNAFDQALLKRFQVIGPPTMLFFNSGGQELTSLRIVGEANAAEFLANLKNIGST